MISCSTTLAGERSVLHPPLDPIAGWQVLLISRSCYVPVPPHAFLAPLAHPSVLVVGHQVHRKQSPVQLEQHSPTDWVFVALMRFTPCEWGSNGRRAQQCVVAPHSPAPCCCLNSKLRPLSYLLLWPALTIRKSSP